jgi:hypothetical protein
MLAGVAPIPACFGDTFRHRLTPEENASTVGELTQ